MQENLKKSYIFKELSENALSDISLFCKEEKFRLGNVIINEDQDESYDMFLLLQGRVDVTISIMDNIIRKKNEKIIETIYPGDVFGEMSCILKKRRCAAVKSVDNSVVLRIDGLKLLNYMENHKDVGYDILKKIVNVLSSRLQNTNFLLRNNFL